MLIAGGTSTLTRQYGIAPVGVVPVDTDVIEADVSFGGIVVGKVGRSDTRCTLPMPAVSQVSTGVLEKGACAAAERAGSVLLGEDPVLLPELPPPPQPTSDAVASSVGTKSLRAAKD
jgi:hypothetical protein